MTQPKTYKPQNCTNKNQMANKNSTRSTKKVSKSIASVLQYQTKRKTNNKSPSSSTTKKRKLENDNNSGNVTSASPKIQNHKKPRLKETPPSEINKKWCHQCRNKREGVVECNKCHSKKYCLSCITKWYPNVSEEKFAEACPVCLNNCNCKACLRGFSHKDMQGYTCSEHDKVQYSRHILQKVIPLVASLNDAQLMEKEIEAKVKGSSLSELQLQDAKCEVDDDIYCDNCGAYIFDFFRSCTCGYDLCLVCSRELRDGHLKGGKGITCGWKAGRDCTIPCPPKDIGGCDDGILELKRIMPIGRVANMLEKAKKMYTINISYDIPQTSTKCCMCYDKGNETTLEKCASSYLFSLSAKDSQPRDMQHFKLHWSKGEPIIVSDVVSTSSGLSWEPMVMWRAFRDITKSRNSSHAYELKAINCSDWSEVTVDLYKFFRGYLEGRFKRKGSPLILKLEDWQPSCLSQGEWPCHFVEFIRYLPFNDYTNPKEGYANISTKLPDLSLKPDMGPRMDIAYKDSVTKLHFDKSDTVNVLTHTESDVLTSSKLNKIKKLTQTHAVDTMAVGALWDIFRRQDVCKVEDYLRNHSAEFSHAGSLLFEQVVHPIHDRTFYLNMEHKRKLKEEFGIEPWTFKQRLGDAVFIPAYCPYQVKNLKSCTKVELNFISPESLGECIRLQNELCALPNNHRARQQKLNIGKMMIYALDQAVTDLSGVVHSNGPIDLHDQFAEVAEILNGNDKNIDNHTNGWVSDTESDDNSHSHETRNARKRSLSSLEVNHTVDHHPAVIKESGTSRETVGLWRGNDVGLEAKELLQAVEHCYPNTFQGVQIRLKPYWQSILKGLHIVIKDFLETSVDALAEDQIHSLHEDLNDCERSGFDLSWAHKRLDMVQKLKYGNDPLRQELMELEKSLVEAHERWKKARLDYDNATDARNKKLEEVAHNDDVLNGNLGFGLLPGY